MSVPLPENQNSRNSSIVLPAPGHFMFVFQETQHPEGGPGRRLGFSNVQVRPRNYEELKAANPSRSLTIPLEMINGTLVETDLQGIDPMAYVNINTTLESPFTAKAIGLVQGGWLPSILAATRINAAILLDRNIVTEIVGRFDGGELTGKPRDFLDLFKNIPVRINPMLYAMEGNNQSTPDLALAEAQFLEVTVKLQRALPAAQLMIGPESLTGLLGLLNDSKEAMANKQAFLLEIAPSLIAPVAHKNMDARFDEVVTAAAKHLVPLFSLVVVAALSCVVSPNGKTPAKGVLKPSAGYSAQTAYNALCDFRSLDILIYILALFPSEASQLCTADKNLALFWCALGVSELKVEGGSINYAITPHTDLLSDHFAQRWRTVIAGQ